MVGLLVMVIRCLGLTRPHLRSSYDAACWMHHVPLLRHPMVGWMMF